MSNIGSIFGSPAAINTHKNPEDKIDTKMSERGDTLKITQSYDDYKEDIGEREMSLRTDERAKIFKSKRLTQHHKIEVGSSLKEKMTIAKDIYEEANKMKPKVKYFYLKK